jgi:putative oxidoreductase
MLRKSFARRIEHIEESVAPTGELILRLALGGTFLAHGRQKLKDPSMFAGFLRQLGVPAPAVAAWGVALLETVGAGLLMAGVATRPLALALAADMAVALAKVRIPKAPFTSGPQQSGWDSELMLLAAALTLVFTGSGRYSVDRAVENALGLRTRRAA